MDIIGGITSAIGLATKAIMLAEKGKNLDLKEIIIDLKGQLLDVKDECLNYRGRIEELEAEIKRLSEPPEMEVKDGLYYKKDGGDGPFCVGCYDSSGKARRLIEATPLEKRMMKFEWKCTGCPTTYS